MTAAVADRAYGTVENYCSLIAQGVRPHMAPMQPADHKSEGRFTKDDFIYDKSADVYICPVGHRLKPRRCHQHRQMTDTSRTRRFAPAVRCAGSARAANWAARSRSTGKRRTSRWRWPSHVCRKPRLTGGGDVISWRAASPTPPTCVTSSAPAGAASGGSASRTGSSRQYKTSPCSAVARVAPWRPNCRRARSPPASGWLWLLARQGRRIHPHPPMPPVRR